MVGSVGGWLAQRGEACDEFRNRWRRRPGHPTRRQPCVSRDVRTFKKEEEEGGRCSVLRPGSFSCSTKEFTLLMYSRDTCLSLSGMCLCFPWFLRAWKVEWIQEIEFTTCTMVGKFQEARGDTNTEKGYDYNTDLSLFFRPLQTSFVNTCRTFTAVRFLSFRGFKWGGGWLR